MSYPVVNVASYFLKRAANESRALTPMQLIKLCYLANGWHLGYLDAPLIDEPIESYVYGPNITTLYNKIKKYGNGAVPPNPIQTLFSSFFPIKDDYSKKIMDSVFNSHVHFSGIQLSAMCHTVGTPWTKVPHNTIIPNELIKKYYIDKITILP